VGVEEIFDVHGRTAELGVEVETARAETAGLEDRGHGEGELAGVGVELVGVPAQHRVASVGVDRAEHVGRRGDFDLVLERVAGERGVVGLDVKLEVLVQAVGAEEADAGRAVEVVLVLGGLLRLGLDEELALEADLLGVIDGHLHECSEVILLTTEVGVEEGLVAFAAAPENVVFATELFGDFHGLLYLRSGVGEDMGVRVGGGAVHEARVAEEVGGAPEELHAGGLLQLFRVGDDLVEVLVGLGEGLAFRRDVAVVERVEGGADLGEELEGGVHALERDGHGVFAAFPRAVDRAGAERIAAVATEGVPVSDGEAEVLRHRLAVDHFVGVIVLECKRVVGFRTIVSDLLYAGDEGFCFFHRRKKLEGRRWGDGSTGNEGGFDQRLSPGGGGLQEPAAETGDGRGSDFDVGDAKRGEGRESGRRLVAVVAGHGAIFRHAQPARLEICDELVGLVVGGADPCGHLVLAHGTGDGIGECGGVGTDVLFADVEHPFRAQFQTLPVKFLDVGRETARRPDTAAGVLPVCKADALVAELGQFLHEPADISVVGVDHIDFQIVVVVLGKHGDDGELFGEHLHRFLGEGVNEQCTAPISPADVLEYVFPSGVLARIRLLDRDDIDGKMVDGGALADALKNEWECGSVGGDKRSADQYADGDWRGFATAPHGPRRRAAVSEFFCQRLYPLPCLGSNGGVVRETARDRCARQLQLPGQLGLIDGAHGERAPNPNQVGARGQ